jgi:hypothetical protein
MTTSNPVFSDIVALLNILYAGDPNIDNAPHGAFWQNTVRNSFVAIRTDDWGVPGALVTPGNAETSNLYLALAGKNSFDGVCPAADARYTGRSKRTACHD